VLRTGLSQKFHLLLERYFPEKRLFLRSDNETRFIRLRPGAQATAIAGSALVVGWAIIATAILIMDNIGAGNFREQAKREQAVYEQRLNALSDERDLRSEEALAAQQRFNTALQQISKMQSQLLASEERRRELEKGIGVIQATLRRTMQERDAARDEVVQYAARAQGRIDPDAVDSDRVRELEDTIDILTAALGGTATQRDDVSTNAVEAIAHAEEMELQLKLLIERNDQIFRQLEEAMTISIEPLDKMFRQAGLPTEQIIDQVRRGYSGLGGPLTPLEYSAMGVEPDADTLRANRLIEQLDRMNLYRLAAEKAPFALPVKSSFRYTSGFGLRWGRMHNGTDFAAPHGTDIFSTADGIVSHAGWQSGYGKLIKIRHDFGVETRYAHLSNIRVKVGQRVSRGQLIGDMGNTGRSTGTHLHYEIRVNGKPVNPMTYIKAANNVF
jgi:murein DD-endopeptidase MepM/ murein hydrolase activator NlpD